VLDALRKRIRTTMTPEQITQAVCDARKKIAEADEILKGILGEAPKEPAVNDGVLHPRLASRLSKP